METLAKIDDTLVDSAMGKSIAQLKKISCEGHGPSAGSDPADPPQRTVTCTIENSDSKSISADGANAKRLFQALALAVPDAVDNAMGGRFGIDIDGVDCKQASNFALEETDPLVGISVASCTLTVSGKAVKVDDGAPKSLELLSALEKAGLRADSAMGKTGVTAKSVSCKGSASQPITCSLVE
jgi:hypothetical protein